MRVCPPCIVCILLTEALLFNTHCCPLCPLQATGFPGKMLPKTAGGSLLDAQSQLDCEITGDCDDIAAAAAIR